MLLVFARTVFDSSANYRSVVVHGRAVAVPADEKEAALLVVSEHLMPGRWDEVRASTRKELAAPGLGVSFRTFLVLGLAGRLLRFGALVALPQVIAHSTRTGGL